MATFQEQLQRCQNVRPDRVERELFEFIKSLRDEMVKLNQDQIYEKSQDIYGNAIGFYSYATEVITKGAKKKGEPFDGKDTGNFLKSFYATVYNNAVFFGASDPKTDDILSSPHWLSHDLFGLTDKNLQMVVKEKILPFVQSYYRKELKI